MENLPEEFLALWKKEEDPEEDESREQEEVELWEEEEEDRERAATSEQEESRRPEERRAAWRPAEKDLLMDVWLVIFERNMDDVEASYARKLKLMEAGAQLAQLGMDGVLLDFFEESFPDYYLSRKELRLRYPNLVFGDITHILAMEYTDEGVPRYVLEGCCNSLQVYSARVSGIGTGALSVFGVVAVRDSIDPKRNPIFNRDRADCQIITEENPYLVLTGPSRAVVMNESVIIEAELKVKGPDEDTYVFAGAGKIKKSPLGFREVTFEGRRGMTLSFEVGALAPCVEATIFIRVIDGTWPAGFHGQFAARTASSRNEIILVQFNGDGATAKGGGDGNTGGAS